jgi:uncharacterized membrane protein YphA (DoxX/SURF4 family)
MINNQSLVQSPTQFGFWLIILFLGVIWLRSGIEKLETHAFPQNLSKTLTFFAGGTKYPWFKSLLLDFAIPQSKVIGECVQWGEVLAGLALIFLVISSFFFRQNIPVFSVLVLFPLFVTLLMNIFFWLAAGWTSPSTDTVNLFMAGIEGICFSVLMYQCWIGR